MPISLRPLEWVNVADTVDMVAITDTADMADSGERPILGFFALGFHER